MQLGDMMRDTITGFTGVAISKHEYLNGCVRWSLQPKDMKDGKPVESQSFDEEQLELVSTGTRKFVTPKGGPARYEPPAR